MGGFERQTRDGRRAWEAPDLKVVGTVGEVLQGGGGKNSPAPSDPGESRKIKGQGNEDPGGGSGS